MRGSNAGDGLGLGLGLGLSLGLGLGLGLSLGLGLGLGLGLMPGLEGLLRLWTAFDMAGPVYQLLPALLSNQLNLAFTVQLIWGALAGLSLAILALILFKIWKETE